jgi:hypothetical protein
MMDPEDLVRVAVNKLFKERDALILEDELPLQYTWAVTINADGVSFSVDFEETYIALMLTKIPRDHFIEVLVEHICSEIGVSMEGGQTWAERNRTLH